MLRVMDLVLEVPTLLLVDVQRGLADATPDAVPGRGRRSTPQAEANVARLLAAWRDRRAPVVHVRHDSVEPNSPLRPGLPGHAVAPEATPRPHEPTFAKTVNSAFVGTGLEAYLHERGVTQLVVAGLTTDHCVSTTVRMAANLGFEVTLVGDATGTFARVGPRGDLHDAETMHAVELAALHGEFATVVDTDEVLSTLP
jgi:nicotinamidase-related amidase